MEKLIEVIQILQDELNLQRGNAIDLANKVNRFKKGTLLKKLNRNIESIQDALNTVIKELNSVKEKPKNKLVSAIEEMIKDVVKSQEIVEIEEESSELLSNVFEEELSDLLSNVLEEAEINLRLPSEESDVLLSISDREISL